MEKARDGQENRSPRLQGKMNANLYINDPKTLAVNERSLAAIEMSRGFIEESRRSLGYTLERVDRNGVWVLTGESIKEPRRFIGHEDAIECARNDCKPRGGTLREAGLADVELKAGVAPAISSVMAAVKV